MSLQALLDARGISKYRLSKMSGVSKTVILDICSGKSLLENCTAKTVSRIASALDCSIESLLSLSSADSKAYDSEKLIAAGCTDNEKSLKEFGIDFHIDTSLKNDLYALIEGIQNNVSYIDCLRDQLLSGVHASYNAGLLTADQAKFIEQNFVFSSRGINNG